MGTVVLDVGDLARLQIRVALGEIWTAVALFAEVGAGLDRGLQRRASRLVRASLSHESLQAIAPVSHPEDGLLPDCLFPSPVQASTVSREAIDAYRSMSVDSIRGAIGQELPEPDRPGAWRKIYHRPRQWMQHFSSGLSEVLDSLGGYQPKIDTLMSRERDRIAVAVVSGAADGLLSSLCRRISFTGTAIRFQHPVSGRYELGTRPLILTPIWAGPRMLLSTLDHPDYAWLGYAVPGFILGTDATEDPLSAVFGPTRAAVLRATEHPLSMNKLAVDTHVTPSTLSFHCDRLTEAGLLARHREGRVVMASRTRRGTAVMAALTT